MKICKTLVGQAVGAVLLAASGSALAYIPTSNTDADIVTYWGGATASTLSAQELAINAVCETDIHLLYVKNTANDGANNDWAIACRTAAAGATKSGLPNDKRVLIVKRDRGGSGVGVGPLQSNATITYLNVDPANCSLPVSPGINSAPAILNPATAGPPGSFVSMFGCVQTAYNVSRVTEIGTSDIEPNKFFGPGLNVPIVDGVPLPYLPPPAPQFAARQALAALVFNNPVTLSLYRALQTAQFPGTVCDSTGNPAGYNTVLAPTANNPRTDVTNGESEACMPSLTKSEINSLLTGKVLTWDKLLENNGAATILPNLPVQICRRVEGSGSQATINAVISSYPCDMNSDGTIDIISPRVQNGTAVGVPVGATVIGNSGSGDVANCLHAFNGVAANPYAIGNLSVEGRNVQKNQNWRYIKVGGVAPTLRNVHAGDYDYWAQQSCQFRLSTLNQNVAVDPDDTYSNKAQVFRALCAAAPAGATTVAPPVNFGLNSIATVLKLNSPSDPTNCFNGTQLGRCGSLYTFGQAGWLATPTAGAPATAVTYDNVLNFNVNPANAFTREVTTGATNICQTPVKSTAGGTNAARGMIVDPNPTWNSPL